jgi:predicted RNA-binding protein with RPS1 domain
MELTKMAKRYDDIQGFVQEIHDHIKLANQQLRLKILAIQQELRIEDDSDGHKADGRTNHTDL